MTTTHSPADFPVPARTSSRIGGLDLARGLAILGMFWAHMIFIADGDTPLGLFARIPHGRSAILFALLAGVSVALMTGRQNPYAGSRMLEARMRIVGRAVVLFLLAGALSMLGTPVILILGFYGFWLILVLPFTQLRVRTLVWLAGVGAFLGPLLIIATKSAFAALGLLDPGDPNSIIYDVFVSGTYPGLQYFVFVVAGLAIGRSNISNVMFQVRLLAGGLVLAIGGYGLAYLATDGKNTWPYNFPWDPFITAINQNISADTSIETLGWIFPTFEEFATAEAHSGSVLETLGSGGFAIAILGGCLLIGAAARHVLYPLAALGSMPLTAYCGHIVALYFFPDWVGSPELGPGVTVVVVSLVVASVWKVFFRRGPLEWLAWQGGLLFSRTEQQPTGAES
ncbi:DUF418 domain-containing protein [Arcanobacterium pinnipediorum]|uniref:DUF1624 domain-containing protein n=1 Tax=Arcanobacterium pinnipediorum TaxID=1503041 RepID=A0ABY5AHU7_9ACTO|nr:DUF418 domain-containing protein [Arcanobacterium pinnipediorum]USR79498.1 DUF1624 domain-containing protein [Arcanobacterium pinnipediorum]